MSGIRDTLIEICEKIIEQNNNPYKEHKGISNHIFDEKGIQMYVGWELTKKLGLEVIENDKEHKLNLQFERKIINKVRGKKDYLDIFLLHEDKRIGIELKFKTKGISINKKGQNVVDEIATREKKEKFKYHFSNQGAETNGHHSFFWDLHRLNDFINKKEIDLGYQIFITNDPSYWKKKKKGSDEGYIIVDQNGKPQISEEKKENNSHKFQMCHDTSLDKKMDAPNWTSVDSINGQNEGRKKLVENLKKKKKKLYCQTDIDLEHVVDDKIEWLPQKIKHLDEEEDNPARSENEKKKTFDLVADDEKQAITKFAFVIVELERKS